MRISKGLLQFVLTAVFALGLGVSFSQQGLSQRPTPPSTPLIRYIIQVPSQDPTQLEQISNWLEVNNFDVAGVDLQQNQIEVVTTDAGIHALNSKGLKGFPKFNNNLLHGPDRRYLNPNSLAQKLETLHSTYPSLTRLVKIGTSLQGRPVMALLISDTPNASELESMSKPTMLFDGLHHAREIMTPEIVVDAAETLLNGAKFNHRAQRLLHRWNIWLVPMVNPDGNNIVWTRNNMWRKNARGESGGTYGVDLNRNYSYKFNGCNGSSGSKSSQSYRGTSPGSEPEAATMMNLANHIRPTVSLSYHSFSELVLYPYGCKSDYSGEKDLIARIGRELAKQLPSDTGRGFYTPGTPWEILYSADGSSMDYMHASFGTLAYTFEVNKDFQPPYSLREPTVIKHRQAWAYLLNRADRNLLAVNVLDGRSGKNVEAQIAVSTISHAKGELPFKTNRAGYFFKVLDPGSYVIAAQLPDGRSSRISVPMNGQPQTVTITVP